MFIFWHIEELVTIWGALIKKNIIIQFTRASTVMARLLYIYSGRKYPENRFPFLPEKLKCFLNKACGK